MADEQRTLALGVQSLVFRAFGSIPGPIVFGVIFDSACIFWQYDCGRQGNCWVYNNTSLSQRALALAIVGVCLNFIFSFLTWIVYPKQNRTEKQDVLKQEHAHATQENGTSEGNEIDTESIESSDSYVIQGPQFPPTKRTSKTRFESHCSEDILLDHDHTDSQAHTETDQGIMLYDLHNVRAQSLERQEVTSPTTRIVVRSPPM